VSNTLLFVPTQFVEDNTLVKWKYEKSIEFVFGVITIRPLYCVHFKKLCDGRCLLRINITEVKRCQGVSNDKNDK
jgi:hypothetical protein